MRTRISALDAFLLACALALGPPRGAEAGIHVSPPGVNVAAHSQTTVLLTFSGLTPQQRAAEALWCGQLVPADPALGSRCNPSTVYGVLPGRYDISSFTGASLFTDVMSIPASVARRAYQAAARGEDATFFYVRRFTSIVSASDEYVPVTLRLTGGGATAPLSVIDVQLGFAVETPVAQVPLGQRPPAVSARISYTGTGRLVGRWEVVVPGQDPPTDEDLLPEASLPFERRGTQRRYAEIERFNVFLPPNGRYTLPGPEPGRLPTVAAGQYLLLLRLEASDDVDADRDLANALGDTGRRAGGVAGFPMPFLRYVVGAGGSELTPVTTSALAVVRPFDGAVVPAAAPIDFEWRAAAGTAYYRLVFESSDQEIHSAFVSSVDHVYRLPPFAATKITGGQFRWRVEAIDAQKRVIARSEWHSVRLLTP